MRYLCAIYLYTLAGELATLKHVDLSNNQLVSIPDNLGIGQLLVHLDVSHNQITELPLDLRKLRTLEYLNVSHNQVGSIPKVFATVLTQLTVSRFLLRITSCIES